jgi:single-strand DNA-binding protein
MAGSVNKVFIVGNLGKDPEVRTMQSGDKVANFSVATSESWKDKSSGEKQERTQWHNIVVFNQNIITVAEKYLKKGSKVFIEGQLETRKWTDNQGIEKYATEIVLRPFKGELTMISSKEPEKNENYSDEIPL